MPVDFNPAALNLFRGAQFEDANAIATLNGKDGLKTSAKLGSNPFRALARSTAEKNANNAVRTELLRSLGTAFGLDGINEQDGKVTFTTEFMDKLEKILGAKVFNKADFGVTASNGAVTSGKPLTQRRISAILGKAQLFAKEGFDLETYKAKFNAMIDDLGKNAPTVLKDVAKGLKFLSVDKPFVRNTVEWDFRVNDLGEDPDEIRGVDRFEYLDPATGEYKALPDTTYLRDQILHPYLGGELIHIERADFRSDKSTDIKPLADYINGTVKSFVMKAIDTYYEAKAAGKVEAFVAHLANPGACMEDKIKKFIEFADKNLTDKSHAMDKAEAAELERIADQEVGPNAKPRDAELSIYDELNALYQKDEYADKEEWADFAPVVKEHLVGKTSIIRVAVPKADKTFEFKPLLDEKSGKPVVRPLTAADIDALGPACVANTLL